METAQAKLYEAARLYAALGHSLRLQAMIFLAAQPSGGAYVSDVVTHLSRAQSTVSHHLKVLVDAGVLATEPHGQWSWYQVVPNRLAELREHLSVFDATTPVLATGVVL